MNTPMTCSAAPTIGKRPLILFGLLILALLCVNGIMGIFRLSPGPVAMRDAIERAAGGQLNKTIALRLGTITTALVRSGLGFVHMKEEPRAAISALRGVEVGVYKVPPNLGRASAHPEALAEIDRAMTARGWERIVAVAQERELVVFYVPRQARPLKNVNCCFCVLQEETLVVGAVRGNPGPLLELAKKHFDSIPGLPRV